MLCLSVATCTCNNIKLDLVFRFPVLRPLLSHMFLDVPLRLYKRELCNRWRCERRVGMGWGGGGAPGASVERSETTTAYIDRSAHETCYCGGPRGREAALCDTAQAENGRQPKQKRKIKEEKRWLN